MTLEELRLIATTLIADKNPAINLPPEQWDILLHFSQLKHYKRKVGLPEEYQPGQPRPSQVYAITQRIDDDLAPFSVHMGRDGELPLVIPATGEALLPADFFYPTGLLYKLSNPDGTVDDKEVVLLTDKEWNDSVSSQIIMPTKSYPIGNIKNGYIRFLPKNLHFVDFTYLRKPVVPVYAYTIIDGFIEYNPTNSIELEWDELNQIDILYILLSDLGIVTAKADIFQISEKVKIQGI
jgi:hypothetical protein